MTDINIGHAVLVIGDTDTADQSRAAGREGRGEGSADRADVRPSPRWAASHDDLTEVDEVVAALSRAIATRTDLWCPFPLQDPAARVTSVG